MNRDAHATPSSPARLRRRGPRWLLLATAALGALGAWGCGDPNRNAGARCSTDGDCEAPLVCSNRDATDLGGICVWPEALPDAARAN
jgi:hypothetical protein